MFKNCRIAVLVVSLCLVAEVAQATPPADIVAQWSGLSAMSLAALHDHDFAKAKRVAAGLLADMAERLGPADHDAATIANVLVIKAIAEHELREERNSIWHWHMAQALDHSVVDRAFSRHVGHSVFLVSNLLIDPLFVPDVHNPKNEPDLQPPVALKQTKPHYPRAASHFGSRGVLIVGAVVGTDGLAHHPKVLKALPAATLTMAALEALKDWQFKPATLNGHPVPVLFGLSVNYHP